MKFPEGVFGSLPRWHNKSKVIVFKIPKIFCTLSGVAISIPEIMVTEIRNLHGFSLSLKSTPGMRSNITTGSPLQKPSLFSGITVKFTYWKMIFIMFKLETSRIFLYFSSVPKLICKELGDQHYQSVLNVT